MIVSFLLLVLLIIIGIIVSFVIDKDIEDTLPPFVFGLLIILYLLAILKKPHHSFELSVVGFVALYAVYFIRFKKIIPNPGELKDKLLNGHIGFLVYFFTILLMFILYGNHIVNNWDDFHFNATFARDLYAYGGMPVGWKSATGYKTYKPLMQLFYNWGFQGTGTYIEPLMFQYKMFLIYTACLPIFKRIDSVVGTIKKICVAVMSVIIPYLFMYEVVDSLSMDCYMGIIAAYCIITIVFETKRDWFYYARIVLSLSALVLVKSSAIMFVFICFGVLFVTLVLDEENRERIGTLLLTTIGIFMVVMGFWLSWKVFCDRNGNTTYLNNALSESISNGFELKWYAKDTFFGCIKNLATLNLNLSEFGMSFLVVFVITLFIALFIIRKNDESRLTKWLYFIIFGGFIPYFSVLLYTYIFVFEEWEALEFSSLDRYLGTYALLLMYVVFYHLTKYKSDLTKLTSLLTILCIVTLNYSVLYNGLNPKVYEVVRKDIIEERTKAEDEALNRFPTNREAESVLLIVPKSQSIYSRGLAYAAIPYVTREVALDAIDTNIRTELANRMNSDSFLYVYFCDEMDNESIKSCDDLILDGSSCKRGTIYRFSKERMGLEKTN